MTSTESKLLTFLDERLDHMLEAPLMWGSTESVELQILQLLEIRLLLLGSSAEPPLWRRVQADYEQFIAMHFPHAPPTTLSALLGDRERDVMSFLGKFIAAQRETHSDDDLLAARNADEIARVEAFFVTTRLAVENEQRRRGTYGVRAVRVVEEATQP